MQSAFGTIYIQLDKGRYSPGEQANGTVFLNVTQNFSGGNELIVELIGREETKMIQRKSHTRTVGSGKHRRTRTTYTYHNHRQDNYFFNHRFPVYRFNSTYVPMGQYSFPISFVVPSGLPSTFKYLYNKYGACYGVVNYTMSAFVGDVQNSIRNVQEFFVNQEIVMDAGMQKKEMEKEITSCCCIGKGATKIVTYFEKNTYEPNEIAYMISEVDNTRCKADIKDCKGQFKQIITLKAGTFADTIEVVHQNIIAPGVPSGQMTMGGTAQRFEIPLKTATGQELQPSCRGNLVQNEYKLHNTIEMDACMCCDHDPFCELNMTVRNVDRTYSAWDAKPSKWQPQVMAPYTAQFNSNFYLPPPIVLEENELNQSEYPPDYEEGNLMPPGNPPPPIVMGNNQAKPGQIAPRF